MVKCGVTNIEIVVTAQVEKYEKPVKYFCFSTTLYMLLAETVK